MALPASNLNFNNHPNNDTSEEDEDWELLLDLESTLSRNPNNNSIQLILDNLEDFNQINQNYSVNNQSTTHLSNLLSTSNTNNTQNNDSEVLSKSDIQSLLNINDDYNVSLICPICNKSLFNNDSNAHSSILDPNIQSCCEKFFKKINKISSYKISYWFYFLNNHYKTITTFPNLTKSFFYSINGIPSQLRSKIWGLILGGSDKFGNLKNKWFQDLFNNLNDDNSPYLRIIINDLNRIFPNLHYFNNELNDGQLNLKKILNAYSIYDSEIGYCQGLPFLISILLFHFKNNSITFLSLTKIFENNKNKNFKKIFDKKMTGLSLWFYQFDSIFAKFLPDLYNYFDLLKIDSKIFLSQWFLSFFAVSCPFQILIKLFDLMILEGFQPTIFKISLIILKKNENLLLNIDNEDIEVIYQHLLSENIWGVFNNDLNLILNDLINIDNNLISFQALEDLEIEFNKKNVSIKEENKTINNNTNTSNTSTSGGYYESPFVKFFRYGFTNTVYNQVPAKNQNKPHTQSTDSITESSVDSNFDAYSVSSHSSNSSNSIKRYHQKSVSSVNNNNFNVNININGKHQLMSTLNSSNTSIITGPEPNNLNSFDNSLEYNEMFGSLPQPNLLKVGNNGHQKSSSVFSVNSSFSTVSLNPSTPTNFYEVKQKMKKQFKLKEMELKNQIESLDSKVQIFEQIIHDDKQLIKKLFKLYLKSSKDVDESKITEKQRIKEYKVLKEVQQRIQI
ncbi:TBC domain-containing protein [Ascoidea rubescens DSM 1968]|uniref:RabGAP/TBC n=1 Tax=Ascoidea rubescens DSM 1968 TaxID=1344418 RepID=A0A1D2VQX0_9ASCO|nr:RabGAP/TBC [Ascoidea rubescens DSM 1968]ODV64002.1 RabGAP/TBC [Ascoidea rubescens DSM 1968]